MGLTGKVFMAHGLFRSQVLEHRQQSLYGSILLLPQLSHTLILSVLLLWVFLVLIWLFTSHYARKETVVGWLEPPEGIIRVYAEQLNILSERYRLVRSQVERYGTLKQNGHVSNVEFDNAIAQALELKSDQQALLRSQLAQKILLCNYKLNKHYCPAKMPIG
jgi:hypothetical protein